MSWPPMEGDPCKERKKKTLLLEEGEEEDEEEEKLGVKSKVAALSWYPLSSSAFAMNVQKKKTDNFYK